MLARAVKLAFGIGRDERLEAHREDMKALNRQIKNLELALNGDNDLFIHLEIKKGNDKEEFVCKKL